jgi:hypothetical protein
LQALFQGKNADWKKKGAESMMGEDSVLERVTAAAEERQPSHNSVIAYRRTWLKIIAWAAEGLVLESYARRTKASLRTVESGCQRARTYQAKMIAC